MLTFSCSHYKYTVFFKILNLTILNPKFLCFFHHHFNHSHFTVSDIYNNIFRFITIFRHRNTISPFSQVLNIYTTMCSRFMNNRFYIRQNCFLVSSVHLNKSQYCILNRIIINRINNFYFQYKLMNTCIRKFPAILINTIKTRLRKENSLQVN